MASQPSDQDVLLGVGAARAGVPVPLLLPVLAVIGWERVNR
jgi:hypothetical protein